MPTTDSLCVNTLRFLAVDQVEAARSGHPGMPLGAAAMAFALWDRHMRFDPDAPDWFGRDRFVLSAGHGSALLYALLHLYGNLPLDELRAFRQWGSRTPGHPEAGVTPGVECTTGPLGQGVSMAVGMAMARAHLAARFDAGEGLLDHRVYAIVSDGDLMEGVAHEAASLAGTLRLGHLVCLYDDNGITIDGSTALAFTEDVAARFEALGWHVQHVEDGNDVDAIDAAIAHARAETERPSLIRVRTHIGFGSPRQDTPRAHGEPLGAEDARRTKAALGWPQDAAFHVPDAVREHVGAARRRGARAHAAWRERLEALRAADADRAARFEAAIARRLPPQWEDALPRFTPDDGPMATRAASGRVLAALAPRLETLVGGSADLAGSNQAVLPEAGDFTLDGPAGRNVHFGVREHAMGAIVNGMARHGGVVPFGATFLVFSDYMRPALRLAALMNVPSTFVFTHDSIGVGEDGPTHQPVEHVMSLRLVPGLDVWRPADAVETAVAWREVLRRARPAALALTRQKLPVLDDADGRVRRGAARGGYVLRDADGAPAVILVATGSEVHLALAAQAELAGRGVAARVVSMPCVEAWREQDDAWRESVLPPGVPRVVIEAGVSTGWSDIVGAPCSVVGLDRFGASAPGGVVMEKLGFTVERVVARARQARRRGTGEVVS